MISITPLKLLSKISCSSLVGELDLKAFKLNGIMDSTFEARHQGVFTIIELFNNIACSYLRVHSKFVIWTTHIKE